MNGKFRFQVATDLVNDGMVLEVWDGKEHVLEVFYTDVDRAMTMSTYRDRIPLSIVEQAISEAKRRLPPEPA